MAFREIKDGIEDLIEPSVEGLSGVTLGLAGAGETSTVFVTTKGGYLFRLNAVTGNLSWDFDLGTFAATSASSSADQYQQQSPALSTDGDALYGGGGGKVFTVDPGTGVALRAISIGGLALTELAVSPDGKAVYMTASDMRLYAIAA